MFEIYIEERQPLEIVHYIVVRRDLPVGVLAAQITHAAGESGALYADWIGGAAVVLGVDSERELEKLRKYLREERIQHVVVREQSEPYNGQLMAIGLVPGDRSVLSPHMRELQLLSSLKA